MGKMMKMTPNEVEAVFAVYQLQGLLGQLRRCIEALENVETTRTNLIEAITFLRSKGLQSLEEMVRRET